MRSAATQPGSKPFATHRWWLVAAIFAITVDLGHCRPGPRTFPDDPFFSEQWALHNTGHTGGLAGADVQAGAAWTRSRDCSPVLLAVIDDGVDTAHPDLAANLWVNPGEVPDDGVDDDANGYVDDVVGYDFANDDGDPSNFDDPADPMASVTCRGTLHQGVLAAVGDNGIGIAGVCWTARVMYLKWMSPLAGSDNLVMGFVSDAVEAIEYATDRGARVTSNGWAIALPSSEPEPLALRNAIEAGIAAGSFFVTGAGHAHEGAEFVDVGDYRDVDLGLVDEFGAPVLISVYPHAWAQPGLFLTTWTDFDDALAPGCFVSSLDVIDTAAPGVEILSTVPSNVPELLDFWEETGFLHAGEPYSRFVSGTPLAVPHLAGALALALSLDPTLDPATLENAVRLGGRHLPELEGRVAAASRLDLYGTLRLAAPP